MKKIKNIITIIFLITILSMMALIALHKYNIIDLNNIDFNSLNFLKKFNKDTISSTIPVFTPKTPEDSFLQTFSGMFISDFQTSKYEFIPESKSFVFYTTIDNNFAPQTKISSYYHIVQISPNEIEFSGLDALLGNGVSVTFCIKKNSESSFSLTRKEPIFGHLGNFDAE